VINWITSVDPSTKQNDTFSLCQKGTGKWLLDSDEFKEWLANTDRIIFCPGMPGAGKTFLTSIVIDHLESVYYNNDDEDKGEDEYDSIAITYIYCTYGSKQNHINLLECLLKQLVQKRPALAESVANFYEQYKDKSNLYLEELPKTLKSVIADYSKIFIVVDAIDELQLSEREKLFSKLLVVRSEFTTNFFVTSRFIPDIEEKLKGTSQVEIRANDEDVKSYLEGRMAERSKIPSFISDSGILQQEIKDKIIEAVDGMLVTLIQFDMAENFNK
jgi:Cdc6-like AAA superfamily ATPase